METVKEKQLPAELRNIGKPNLVALSYALRHPETWPQGFIWDYGDCEKCAMGLASRLWRIGPKRRAKDENYLGAYHSWVAQTFMMSYEEADLIFMGSGDWVPYDRWTTGHLWWKENHESGRLWSVTPNMVADQIDAHLARVE